MAIRKRTNALRGSFLLLLALGSTACHYGQGVKHGPQAIMGGTPTPGSSRPQTSVITDLAAAVQSQSEVTIRKLTTPELFTVIQRLLSTDSKEGRRLLLLYSKLASAPPVPVSSPTGGTSLFQVSIQDPGDGVVRDAIVGLTKEGGLFVVDRVDLREFLPTWRYPSDTPRSDSPNGDD